MGTVPATGSARARCAVEKFAAVLRLVLRMVRHVVEPLDGRVAHPVAAEAGKPTTTITRIRISEGGLQHGLVVVIDLG